MKKNLVLYLTTLLILFLFSTTLFAQQSLSLEASSISPKTDYQPYGLVEFSLYQLDAKAILEFSKQKKNTAKELNLYFSPEHHWKMILEPSKVFSDNFQYNLENGQWHNPDIEIRTFKGYLKDQPNIPVRLTVAENFIHGMIFDQAMHSFEMVEEGLALSENTEILVLEGANTTNESGCSHDSNIAPLKSIENFPTGSNMLKSTN